MNTSNIAIRTVDLSKHFSGGLRGQGVKALSEVSLDVNYGEIFGLLGPNGAGKTTLVKILLGSLHPTSGSASINGHDVGRWQARAKAGFLPENHRFPQYLTGLQMLYCFGGMTGLSRSQMTAKAGELLELVDMTRWKHTRIKKYSKGMMQRLGLAQALISDPEIVFLDEPTDGVDPIGRREIRDILKKLKAAGKTIFLNSHLLAEVESVCDRVAILDKGRMIKSGPVAGLIGTEPQYSVEVAELTGEMQEKIRSVFSRVEFSGNAITVKLDKAERINSLVDMLRHYDIGIVSVVPHKVSLEESFMTLIRGEATHE